MTAKRACIKDLSLSEASDFHNSATTSPAEVVQHGGPLNPTGGLWR